MPSNAARTRLGAAIALVALALGLAYLGHTVYRALSDTWVAPLRLSPDNDRVVALRLEYVRQEAERRKMESELTGIGEMIRSLDLSIERLDTLRAAHDGALDWAAGDEVRRRRLLESELATIEQQRELLDRLLGEHRAILAQSKADLDAGLIGSSQHVRAELALKQLEYDVQANERQRLRAVAELQAARSRGGALASAAREPASERLERSAAAPPDVLDFDEPAIRLEIELARLRAERRAADARRDALNESLAAMDEILAELQARPLYRAMSRDTDLAFVPYAGLSDVKVGNSVYRCAFAVVDCERVGTVTEIVPGEVVTQDPWGEIARGQYVVLSVRDRTALHEKVLRVRPGKRRSAAGLRLAGAGKD